MGSYRDTVSDSDRHHGRLPETQEALYAVFVLHVKEDFSQLDTDLKFKHDGVKHCETKFVALCVFLTSLAAKTFLLTKSSAALRLSSTRTESSDEIKAGSVGRQKSNH